MDDTFEYILNADSNVTDDKNLNKCLILRYRHLKWQTLAMNVQIDKSLYTMITGIERKTSIWIMLSYVTNK